MPFSDEVNNDALSMGAGDVALGPRVGALDAFETSYQAQVRASAQNGMTSAYADEEDAQIRTLKEAGIENIPRIGADIGFGDMLNIGPDPDTGFYKDAIRSLAGISDDESIRTKLGDYDKRIDALRKERPDLKLKNSRELMDTVVEKGRQAEKNVNQMRTTTAGAVGEFLGGAVASMNPRTDPLNALTFGVGGFGKTAAARIGTEMGAQGVIETMNQVTGVQEQRKIMGLDNGVMDAVSRVGGTMLGAGVLRGAGEALAYGGKRFFRNTEADPAPLPPKSKDQLLLEYKPSKDAGIEQGVDDLMNGGSYTRQILPLSTLTGSRMGDGRTMLDLDYFDKKLQSWDGEAPSKIVPRSETAIVDPVKGVSMEPFELKGPGKTLDVMAREVDPDAFRIYDKLAAEKVRLRQMIDGLGANQKKVADVTSDLSDKIDELRALMARSGAKARKKQQVELDALLSEREATIDKVKKRDTPEQALVRNQLQQVDYKMRDMAPVVSRAYAHAQKQWDLGAEDRALVRKMIRDGSRELPVSDRPILTDTYENTAARFDRTITERVPILEQAPRVEAKMRKDSDAADYVQAIIKDNMEIFDKGIERYRAEIAKVMSEDGDGTLQVMGTEYKFNIDEDKIAIPQEEGSGGKMVSIRELLRENMEVEENLKAVSSCSIK